MFLEGSWSFNLLEYTTVWKDLLQIMLLLGFLLIGNAIRRLVPFLKKAFIPSALIGGLLLLGIDVFCRYVLDFELVDRRVMQIITYHALAIGFIAMSLKTVEKKNNKLGAKAVMNGMLTGGTYMLQAVCGLIVSLIFFYLGIEKFYDAGIILPLGFGQGPGNALTWDVNFSEVLEYEFTGNGSFGLTIASVGFVVASIGGLIYINYFKRKGEIVYKEEKLNRSVEDFEKQGEIQDSESVDKSTIQMAFVGISYLLAFLIMVFLSKLSDWTGVALFDSIAWGFNFIFGVITATLVKTIMNLLHKKNVVTKYYINNYQMDRISGTAFDLMIVAGVAAIDINVVKKYAWLIIALCVVGTLVTFIYVKIITKHCFKDIKHEAFLVNFGTLTGTASNGMIMLREIDPNYETPTSSIYIISQFPAMLFVAPLLLLLSMSAKSITSCFIALGIFFALFVIYTVFLLLMGKGKIFKGKEKEGVAESDSSEVVSEE